MRRTTRAARVVPVVGALEVPAAPVVVLILAADRADRVVLAGRVAPPVRRMVEVQEAMREPAALT